MCRYVCKAGAAAQGIRSGFWAKSIEVEEANKSSQISTMPFSRSITSLRPFSPFPMFYLLQTQTPYSAQKRAYTGILKTTIYSTVDETLLYIHRRRLSTIDKERARLVEFLVDGRLPLSCAKIFLGICLIFIWRLFAKPLLGLVLLIRSRCSSA
ncbi:hypothetical protein F5880DRAFT_772679 [Lentinula raphanica]|nr:hypothetical protein F5880DRAFT_772679 [Lentinula raphanica]